MPNAASQLLLDPCVFPVPGCSRDVGARTDMAAGDPPEPPLHNEVGEQQAGWELWGYDEDNFQMLLALDLTGGKVPDNEQNALLSDEAKEYMAYLHECFPDQ